MSGSLEACTQPHKMRFATAQAAEKTARKWLSAPQIRGRLADVRSFKPYLCPCGWWHLTSQPRR